MAALLELESKAQLRDGHVDKLAQRVPIVLTNALEIKLGGQWLELYRVILWSCFRR